MAHEAVEVRFRSFVGIAENRLRERGYEVKHRNGHLRVTTNFGRFPRERIMEIFKIADECRVKVCMTGTVDISLDGSALVFKRRGRSR